MFRILFTSYLFSRSVSKLRNANSKLRAVPPFRRSQSRESKTSSKKKLMWTRSADLRERGAPSSTRRAHIYKDFLTRAKDFAVKEGHVWKMETYFFVGRLIVERFSQCVAKVRPVTIFRLSFKPVVKYYLILGWSQLRTFKWMWICVMGNFMEECMSQKFGMRLYR